MTFFHSVLSMICLLAGSVFAEESKTLPPNEIDPGFVRVSTEPAEMSMLTVEGTIGDILGNPAFSGFAPLIMPWDGRDYDPGMPITAVASLLPYHGHVDPTVVTDSLNRMVRYIAKGDTVFFDIYSEAEKQADPTKRLTGLFFYRGKRNAPFAIIAPGGGFAYVGSLHEGFPYAARISDAGLNAFVIRYRAGFGGSVATEDLAAAITFIFKNADRLGVDTKGYSVWGSSAGARMAAYIGSHGVSAFGQHPLPKPAAVIMAYTSHSDLSSHEPPTFAVVGADDGIAPASTMARRIKALRAIGTEVEFKIYPDVGHGFGLGTGTSADGWIEDALAFWRKRISADR